MYAATFLTNRSPTNAIVDNKTPFEMWYGKRPNASKFKVFGCTAYIQIPKEKRRKLDSRSKQLVFVGYANNGFRLWDSQMRSNITSRNVVFDESELERRHHKNNGILQEEFESDTLSIRTINQESCNNNEIHEFEEDSSIIGSKDVSTSILTPVKIERNIKSNLHAGHLSNEAEEGVVVDLTEQGSDSGSNSEYQDVDEEKESPEPTLRRSERKKRPPTWWKDYGSALKTSKNTEVPQTTDELKTKDDWEQWKTAISNELKSLDLNKTWSVVNCIPSDRKPIQSKWVFTVKDDGRYKARLVAKGCSQRPGFDYQDTFAPVAKMESVRTILSIANEYKLLTHQIDVTTAFLYGDLEETIYMQLSNYEMGKPQKVLLLKSLY